MREKQTMVSIFTNRILHNQSTKQKEQNKKRKKKREKKRNLKPAHQRAPGAQSNPPYSPA